MAAIEEVTINCSTSAFKPAFKTLSVPSTAGANKLFLLLETLKGNGDARCIIYLQSLAASTQPSSFKRSNSTNDKLSIGAWWPIVSLVCSIKVLLTGISGWIAKHTAIELLNAGYEVLGTVRNNTLIEQTKETISQHASIDKLSFVELDLLKDDGWNEAAQGCKYIMHLASPFPYKVSNNRDSLLAPAVDGTLRVLNAGVNANVEQIIKTSSIVAMFRKPNRSNPYTFGENDWTDENWTKGVTDYFLSKTKAERLAWELMESKGLKNKLTTICPGGVFGDALDKKGGTSIEYVRQFLKGKFPAAPKWGVLISDVKDVAKAHVACIGNNNVGGRRLIVGKEVKTLIELSQIMAEAMPEYAKKLPKKHLPNFMVKLFSYLDSSAKTMIPDLEITMQTDNSYAEDLLGLKFNPAKGCISETAKSVVRLGLV